MKLHHVQLSMQHGSEQLAREFYAGALEFTEVPKPEALRSRGGCWAARWVSASAPASKAMSASMRVIPSATGSNSSRRCLSAHSARAAQAVRCLRPNSANAAPSVAPNITSTEKR